MLQVYYHLIWKTNSKSVTKFTCGILWCTVQCERTYVCMCALCRCTDSVQRYKTVNPPKPEQTQPQKYMYVYLWKWHVFNVVYVYYLKRMYKLYIRLWCRCPTATNRKVFKQINIFINCFLNTKWNKQDYHYLVLITQI